jgi:hypothetical protein
MRNRVTTPSKSILIVEDNELNMTLWSDILEAQGYALFKTAFGVEALRLPAIIAPTLSCWTFAYLTSQGLMSREASKATRLPNPSSSSL